MIPISIAPSGQRSRTSNTSVFLPRYFPNKYKTKVAEWKLSGGFQDDESRDLAAIENCTHFIAKDFNSKGERISGTMKNILKCRALNKVEISIT